MKKGSRVKIVSTQENQPPWKKLHWGYRENEDQIFVRVGFKDGKIYEVSKARGVKPDLFGKGPESGYVELICDDGKTGIISKEDIEEVE